MYEWQDQCLAIAGIGTWIHGTHVRGQKPVADALMFQRLRSPADALALAIFPFVDLCNSEAHVRARGKNSVETVAVEGVQGGVRERSSCARLSAQIIVSQLLNRKTRKLCCVVADEIHGVR